MPQTSKVEQKKFAQSQLIAEFPNVCSGHVSRRLSNHIDPEYNPEDYPYLVGNANNNIFYNLYRGEGPVCKDEWKQGLEVELEKAWNAELAKIKEDILKRAREKIPRVCVAMVNGYCIDLRYPDLKESGFERFIHNLHVGGDLNLFQDSWKEDLRGDIETAWEAEILKAKAFGRIPSSLWDAFQNAWEHMVRTDPFANHDKITLRGIHYTLINLVMLYPKRLWETWTDRVKYDDLIKHIPVNLHDKIFCLQDKINARGE